MAVWAMSRAPSKPLTNSVFWNRLSSLGIILRCPRGGPESAVQLNPAQEHLYGLSGAPVVRRVRRVSSRRHSGPGRGITGPPCDGRRDQAQLRAPTLCARESSSRR
jgi:hypothetical protein